MDGSSVSFHGLELHPCNAAPSRFSRTETITHLDHGTGLLLHFLSKELNHSLSAGCPWVCVCLLWMKVGARQTLHPLSHTPAPRFPTLLTILWGSLF